MLKIVAMCEVIMNDKSTKWVATELDSECYPEYTTEYINDILTSVSTNEYTAIDCFACACHGEMVWDETQQDTN